eukprot:CAMPEP_0173424098 /NCGR_PEP_ID=MMETSP1357-20121228/4109_1 /TAXON_ID=77926 /ORGANISM="Hemiselmis rufescens, Strain PCC563" /LENGTH=221 /DNA_ID=CAMNT_0014387269 /DNA_START=152 /DNA_END=818 /DNA_ORIENTATION=-
MATVNVDEVKVALPAKGELSKAAASGDLEGVMVLLQRGADPNEATDAKETPLHLATNPSVDPSDPWHALRRPAQLRELVNGGANVEARQQFGWTALQFHARKGNHEPLKVLVEDCGAAVDAPEGDGSTPLIGAAYEKKTLCVMMLLALGADKTIKNQKNCTAETFGDAVIKALLASHTRPSVGAVMEAAALQAAGDADKPPAAAAACGETGEQGGCCCCLM